MCDTSKKTPRRTLTSAINRSHKPCSFAHAAEDASRIPQERLRRVEFRDHASVQDQNAITLHDGVQAVGNSQDCTLPKLCFDGFLNESVCLHIASSSRFIKDQNLGFAQHCPSKTDKLTLANTEILSSFVHGRVKSVSNLVDGCCEMAYLQSAPNLIVGVLLEGIQIGADGATKEDSILRHNRDATTQILQPDLRDVQAVNQNFPSGWLEDAEQRHCETGLASAGAPNYANFLAGSNLPSDALQHKIQSLTVSDSQFLERDDAIVWPAGVRAWLEDFRRLTGKTGILTNTLNRNNINFKLRSASNQPVEARCDGHGVAQSKTSQARIDSSALDHSEQTREQQNQVADHFKPNGQPAICSDRGIVRLHIGVQQSFVHLAELLLPAICANGPAAVQGLVEVGVDW
eukprot:m.114807 g.114807  ORF g.114807 m.114807 type:complete len:403 (-) comp51902_c0_seq1:1871-3079(-)